MNGAWTRVSDLPAGSLFVPRPTSEPRCRTQSPDRYRCTRRKGHTGRHAAILISTGEVYAVWPEPEPTA